MASALQSFDDSFVTVLINAHGRDITEDKAKPDQERTLRKFTVPGKCGHLTYSSKALLDTIFDISYHQFATQSIPFTEKLKMLKTQLIQKYKFNELLQEMYECQPKSVKDKNTSCPTVNDWFSPTQVSYNHQYSFMAYDRTDPWENSQFGIWQVDGSNYTRIHKKHSIMDNIGIPRWDATGIPKWPYDITLFELANRLKQFFNVKYVNFIDLSCRYVAPVASGVSDNVTSAELRDITPKGQRLTFLPSQLEIMDKQPHLPPNWQYVKNPKDGNYVFYNTTIREISTDFPGTLPPNWIFLKNRKDGGYYFHNTATGDISSDFPGRYPGGSKKYSKKNKKTKKSKNK